MVALLCNFIEITLRHGCSFVDLLRILRTPFFKNTYGLLLLYLALLSHRANNISKNLLHQVGT